MAHAGGAWRWLRHAAAVRCCDPPRIGRVATYVDSTNARSMPSPPRRATRATTPARCRTRTRSCARRRRRAPRVSRPDGRCARTAIAACRSSLVTAVGHDRRRERVVDGVRRPRLRPSATSRLVVTTGSSVVGAAPTSSTLRSTGQLDPVVGMAVRDDDRVELARGRGGVAGSRALRDRSRAARWCRRSARGSRCMRLPGAGVGARAAEHRHLEAITGVRVRHRPNLGAGDRSSPRDAPPADRR